MSEIKTDKFTGTTTAGSIVVTGEGNSTTTNLQQGLTKGWGHYEGSDETLDDSFNMASVTDGGSAGVYSPQFTNNMANTNYVVNCNFDSSISSSNQTEASIDTYAAGSFKITIRDGGSTVDKDDIVFSVHGDLA
jgi:hypothetical protein